MNKIIFYVAILAAALATCQAAIKQDGLFNCAGAQQLGTLASNNCCQLCHCLGTQSGKSAFKMPTIQTYCKQQCSKCVAAANDKKQCPNSNSALPAACSQGLAFNAQVKSVMNKCADMYMKDPSALRKVPGC